MSNFKERADAFQQYLAESGFDNERPADNIVTTTLNSASDDLGSRLALVFLEDDELKTRQNVDRVEMHGYFFKLKSHQVAWAQKVNADLNQRFSAMGIKFQSDGDGVIEGIVHANAPDPRSCYLILFNLKTALSSANVYVQNVLEQI